MKPFFARPQASGVDIKKLQKTCFDETKRHRLEPYEGARIRNNPNCPQLDVDKWGNSLQTV